MKRLPAALSLTLILSLAPLLAQGQDDAAPSYSRDGADSCLSCHEDAVTLAVFKTSHGVPTDPRSPFGSGQLQCEACHGPGGDHAGRVRRGQERPSMPHFATGSQATTAENNAMCLDCHAANAGAQWHDSAHDFNEVGCADCHNSHAVHDPVQQVATQPEVCFECHQAQRAQVLKPFAHPIADGKMDCSGCHAPHGEQTANGMARQTLNDTCFECHAEKRGPYLWEHAPVTEDCGDCHAPHGSNHPGMLSQRGPLLCQSCHSQAGHPSVPYQDSALAGGTASAFLLGQNCLNCHSQVHGSNHPSGSKLMR